MVAPPATTTGGLLRQSSTAWPDRLALAFPDRRVCYAELAEDARSVARGLRALGVRHGDHVGILMPNCTEFVEAFFGVTMLGAVACLVNARYKSDELGFVVAHADLSVLLTTGAYREHLDFASLLAEALPGLGDADPGELSLEAAPRLRHVVSLGGSGGSGGSGMLGPDAFARAADTVGCEDIDREGASVGPEDLALLLYTSGTTARPKGCLSTHGSIVRGSRAAGARWSVRSSDVTWGPLPLFHHGSLQPLLYTLDVGGTFVSAEHFDAAGALRLIAREHPTIALPTFPTVTLDLIEHPGFASTDTSSLRALLNIGPPEILRKIQAAFPRTVVAQGTGLTEGGGQLAYGDLDAPLEQRLTSIGRPHEGIEVRIVDGAGHDVPRGEPGEMWLRSFTLFSRYHKDAEATAAVLDDAGWLHTGDQYRIDGSGWLQFLGRLKEVIKVGGENVSPAEIEAFVMKHPAVRLAQAVGVPDRRLGEVVAVFIELVHGQSLGAQDVIAFCRGRIAGYRVPRYVRFVQEWPMSATKIQRFKLRELILADLGSEAPAPG